MQEKMMKLLREEGTAVLLEPSRGEHGTLFVGGGGSRSMGSDPALPSLVVAIEHYSRIARLLEKGLPVKLEINIQNRFYEDDSLGYNVVAEIPGTDKKLKDEVVMLGGHLDSWHAGTGATDNAAGCAVAMEAVRILKAIGVQPRRTIRIALWSGEEQGLLGSRGYAQKHFGDRGTMRLKPEHEKFSAYFNLDNGTGKIRGVYLQGNDAVRPIFEAWLKPFHDLGANTLTIRNTGGTDHLSFDAVGLPGFQFIQDRIDYDTRTHHTNMDVYDHALDGDLIQASVIMASFVYHTAMRDEKLPRKPLPKPEQPPRMTMQ
jgi:Zn-dependent M28 family amino/carboxypeptidase